MLCLELLLESCGPEFCGFERNFNLHYGNRRLFLARILLGCWNSRSFVRIAGKPADFVAEMHAQSYAEVFEDNRIQSTMMEELNKDVLQVERAAFPLFFLTALGTGRCRYGRCHRHSACFSTAPRVSAACRHCQGAKMGGHPLWDCNISSHLIVG